MTIFSNRTMQFLEKALDGASEKQKAIAHNMANVNTPGFKSIEVNFKEQLRRALNHSEDLTLRATDHKHMTGQIPLEQITPQIKRNNSTSTRADRNNVDVDKEMAEMAQNTIYNNAAVLQLNKRIALLKHVIAEGGK